MVEFEVQLAPTALLRVTAVVLFVLPPTLLCRGRG